MDFFGILFDIKNGSKMPYSKNYFDTLFAAKLEELGVKTITGTLPLTFITKAGNAVDWVISGNDAVYEGQQGVGERTENLVEAKIANTNINNNGQIISNPDYATWVVPVNQGVTYAFTTDGAVYAEYTEYPVMGSVAYNNKRVTATTVFTATIDGYIAFRTSPDYATAMCVIGSTAPTTYIPHGYQIPLTVSQQGQTDKNYDIFIGDSPLTEGETVSKTSTGVDIELFEGSNTVSTTLYNKPTMEIKYK